MRVKVSNNETFGSSIRLIYRHTNTVRKFKVASPCGKSFYARERSNITWFLRKHKPDLSKNGKTAKRGKGDG